MVGPFFAFMNCGFFSPHVDYIFYVKYVNLKFRGTWNVTNHQVLSQEAPEGNGSEA